MTDASTPTADPVAKRLRLVALLMRIVPALFCIVVIAADVTDMPRRKRDTAAEAARRLKLAQEGVELAPMRLDNDGHPFLYSMTALLFANSFVLTGVAKLIDKRPRSQNTD